MENLSLAWLWIGTKRRKVLNPLAKAIVVIAFIFAALIPCPFGANHTTLFLLEVLVIVICVTQYIIFSLNDHKIWLAIFLGVQVAGCILIGGVSFSYCLRGAETVNGLALQDLVNYQEGVFTLTNGQAALSYSAILGTEDQNIMMAPLVPWLSQWNTSMPVQAWAFAQVPATSDGTDIVNQWSDPNLHSGTLSTDSTLQEYLQMLLTRYPQLKVATPTFFMLWGPLDAQTAFILDISIIVYVAVSVTFVVVLAAWAYDYYKLFYLSRPDSEEEENLYLLKSGKSFYASSEA